MADLLTEAAKGAVAGAALGPFGALGGAVIGVLPEAARWVFGNDQASKTAQTAAQAAIASVTGTSDLAGVQAVVTADPEKAVELRVALARITAEHEQAMRVAHLADIADARRQTVDLATTGSWLAWGAPIVSVLVLLTFGLIVGLTLTRSMPSGSEPILNVLLGTLSAMAMSVVSYWVGSSVGSARKGEYLAERRSFIEQGQRQDGTR